jgi:thioredoxin reductase
MYDLIIIGGGPAALASAMFALGKQINLLMIYDNPGGKTGAHQRLVGQLGEEHLVGEDVVHLFERQVLNSGKTLRDRVTQVTRTEGGFQVVTQQHGVKEATAVLIATGATPIPLDVPGSQEFLGWGLGYSVATHAGLLAGKSVAVIGSSERALRGVLEVAQTASTVYVIPIDATALETPLGAAVIQQPNVSIFPGCEVTEINGGFNVEELVICQGSETRRLAVDAAFVDLGLVANSQCVRGLLRTDDNGFIRIDDRCATEIPGVFAAGDVTTGFGEMKLIAIGDGARAALSAYEYVLLQRTRATVGAAN